MLNWQERIVFDPEILVGKPTVKGTRLSVEFLLDVMAGGSTHEEILANYPKLSAEDLLAVLAYAADSMRHESIFPLAI